jgi:hypothetical protein
VPFILVILGALIAGAAVGLARAYFVGVTRATSGQTEALAIALKRLPLEVRLKALAERAPSGSFERRLAIELQEAPAAERGAVLNEHLAEVGLALEARASWPRAALRLVVYGELLLMVFALVTGSRAACVILVLLTMAGVAACAELGRRADALARTQRAAVDALVDALLGRRPGDDDAPRLARRPSGRRRN